MARQAALAVGWSFNAWFFASDVRSGGATAGRVGGKSTGSAQWEPGVNGKGIYNVTLRGACNGSVFGVSRTDDDACCLCLPFGGASSFFIPTDEHTFGPLVPSKKAIA
jgi:hypothetical protein